MNGVVQNSFVEAQSPVIAVTLAYLLLYYVFLLNGLRVKRAVFRACRERGERFDMTRLAIDQKGVGLDRLQR